MAWGILAGPFAVHPAHFVFEIFSVSFTFILGSNFLLPQRANNGKVDFTQIQNPDFDAWGIQTGPFAVHSAHFVLKLFCLFHFHTGEPFLITPEDQ